VTPDSTAAAGGVGGGDIRLHLDLPQLLTHACAPLDGGEAGDAGADRRSTDGRLARGQRTRRNVAHALIELLQAGIPLPTAREVAQRAEVSLRLVFHHFGDMDDLYHYVAALQLRRQWQGMPDLSPQLALGRRIERTVAHRASLFEEITPVRRALARRGPSSGVVEAVAAADALLFEDVRTTFAPEISALPSALRSEYLGAMDTAASWESWERLRSTSGVGVRPAKRVVARMLTLLSARNAGAGGRIGPRVARAGLS
jgi:TetR/AcrR family transcriptional regulator, regulator of autoinduction and epiphytic fitness